MYGAGEKGEGHNLACKTQRVEVELERSEVNSAQLVNLSTSQRGDGGSASSFGIVPITEECQIVPKDLGNFRGDLPGWKKQKPKQTLFSGT